MNYTIFIIIKEFKVNRKIKHMSLLSTLTLCAFLSACGGSTPAGTNSGSTSGNTDDNSSQGGTNDNITPVTQPATPKPIVSPDFWLFNANPNGIASSRTPLQLWTTDGTTDGTKVLNTSTKIIKPKQLFAHLDGGKKVVFMGQDSTHGREPFVSDGTAAGTHIIKDINAGTANSMVTQMGELMISVKDKAYFTVYKRRGNARIALYETDGTSAGTREVLDNTHTYTDPTTNKTYNIQFGGTYYRTDTKNLYVTLQENGGTYKLFKISTNQTGANALTPVANIADGTILNGVLVFNGHRYGQMSNNKFVKITDSGMSYILPNLTPYGQPALTPTSYVNTQNDFFSSNDKVNIMAAADTSASARNTIKFVHFKKDGSTAITSPNFPDNTPLNTRARIYSMFVNDKGLYIGLEDRRTSPTTALTLRYPFKSNGELSNTPTRLSLGGNASAHRGIFGSDLNDNYRVVNNTLVFESDDTRNTSTCEGYQLWAITNDTTKDRIKITNEKGSNATACPRSEILFLGGLKDNSLAVFSSNSGVDYSKGRELWVTDGTPANTKMLKDIAPGLTNATKNGVSLR